MMLWLSSGKYNYNLYSEDGSATESDFVSGMSMGRSSLRLVYMSNLDSQLQEKSIRYYALELSGGVEGSNWRDGLYGEVFAAGPTTPYSILLSKLKNDQCVLIRTPNNTILYKPEGVNKQIAKEVAAQCKEILFLQDYKVVATPEELVQITSTEPAL